MKRNYEEQPTSHKNIGGTIFVFVGFVAFILVFASLGSNKSFREPDVSASLASFDPGIEYAMSLENQAFINTYMPYFEYFALKYPGIYNQ